MSAESAGCLFIKNVPRCALDLKSSTIGTDMLKNKEVEISIILLIIRHLKGLTGAIEKYLEALKGESNG